MNGVVVGVDESHHAGVALRWAAEYARLHQLPIKALMAWDYIGQHHLAGEPAFDPGYSEKAALEVLDELIVRALGPQHAVTCAVALDRPGPALIAAAADADLLVVGARGLGGFRGLLLGSVSRHVLRDATCPVAVIRDALDADAGPDGDGRIGRIVVGLDGSEPSRRALRWAIAHAAASPGASVDVAAVYVWSPPYSVTGFYAKFPDPANLEHAALDFVRAELAAVDQSALSSPVEAMVLDGRPSARLLDAAADASLLVVGWRGHGTLAGTMLGSVGLGSVSEQLTQHAACPVVVVP